MRRAWLGLLLGALGLVACGEEPPPEWSWDGGTRPSSGRRDAGTVGVNEPPPLEGADTAFGVRGRVTTDFSGVEDEAAALLAQPDGKLVAVGSAGSPQPGNWSLPQLAIARYTVDGVLDTTFNKTGKVTAIIGRGGGRALGVHLLDGGKLLVTGYVLNNSVQDLVLMRLDTRGLRDLTFGVNGVATFGSESEDEAGLAIAVLPDGKVLVAGRAGREALAKGCVVRFTADGKVDTTFGLGGRVLVDEQYEARALAVEPDGAFVVAGDTLSKGGSYLVRFLANGTRDVNFPRSRPSGISLVRAMVRQPDGRLVIGGASVQENRAGFGLMRFLPDGTVDTSFGQNGLVMTAVRGDDRVRGLVLQQDGRLLAAGDVGGFFSQVGLARYLPDGSLDPSFGSGGVIAGSLGYVGQDAAAVTLHQQGVVIAGRRTLGDTPSWDFLLARFRL